MEQISKESIATLASIFYMVMSTIDKVDIDDLDMDKLETIVTNKILEKCTTTKV